MSGRRELWPTNGGYPVADVDLQTMSDAGAGADDLVYESLFLPGLYADSPAIGNFRKRVMPLIPENNAFVGGLGTSGAGSAANLVTQGTAGVLTIRAALFSAFGPSAGATDPAQLVAIVAKLRDSAFVNLTSGGGGNPRYDLLYATVQRTNGPNVSRLVKSTVDGTLSTQSVAVYSDASVTFTLLPGTPAATPAMPSLPADTSTAWNIPIAAVLVPNAYVAGTNLLTAGGSITPIWRRAGIAPEAITSVSELALQDSGGVIVHAPNYWMGDGTLAGGTYKSLPLNGGSQYRLATQVELISAGTAVLDNARDWSMRLVRINIVLATPFTGGGDYFQLLPLQVVPGPDGGVNAAGSADGATWDSGWVFSGQSGGSGTIHNLTKTPAGTIFNTATTGSIIIKVDSSNRLTITFGSGIAGGITGHPRFFVMVEFSDRLVAP